MVVASLSQSNSELALANVLGSCTANILGSFSIGLIFAPNPLTISPDERFSARLYSTLLVLLSIVLVIVGPGYNALFAQRGNARESAGRWVGIVLLITFCLYVGGIAVGIQRGKVSAPEGSDSDSDGETEDGGEVRDQTASLVEDEDEENRAALSVQSSMPDTTPQQTYETHTETTSGAFSLSLALIHSPSQ